MSDLVLAVDVGGTRTRAAVVNDQGRVLARTSFATRPERGVDDTLARIDSAVRQVLGTTPLADVRGIGVTAPGPLDPWTGELFSPPNMPGWEHVPLKQYIEERFGRPTLVGNDANLAALGEHRFGAGRGVNDMIYLTISTGIGGGVILGGKLFVGAHGFAGEVGHQTVEARGPRCNCGNIGCLEIMASGPAIAREARSAIAAGEATSMLELAGGKVEAITGEHITQAALAGDALARSLYARAGFYIGVGIVNLIHLFNPDLFVLGGGVTNAGELLFAPIRQTVDERAIPIMRKGVRIERAELRDDVGLLGATALVLQQGL